MLTPLQQLKMQSIHLLFNLFQENKLNKLTNYESVDNFYSYIGYDLESEGLLRNLNIHGTSVLQKLLIDYNDYLDIKLEEDVFVKRHLSEFNEID